MQYHRVHPYLWITCIYRRINTTKQVCEHPTQNRSGVHRRKRPMQLKKKQRPRPPLKRPRKRSMHCTIWMQAVLHWLQRDTPHILTTTHILDIMVNSNFWIIWLTADAQDWTCLLQAWARKETAEGLGRAQSPCLIYHRPNQIGHTASLRPSYKASRHQPTFQSLNPTGCHSVLHTSTRYHGAAFVSWGFRVWL